MLALAAVCGWKNDWHTGGSPPAFHHGGKRETILAGHLDIRNEQGKFPGHQCRQSFVPGGSPEQAVTRIVQHHFKGGWIFLFSIH